MLEPEVRLLHCSLQPQRHSIGISYCLDQFRELPHFQQGFTLSEQFAVLIILYRAIMLFEGICSLELEKKDRPSNSITIEIVAGVAALFEKAGWSLPQRPFWISGLGPKIRAQSIIRSAPNSAVHHLVHTLYQGLPGLTSEFLDQ
jgi:hypothetical protein